MRILGVDVGTRRIGVAVSDPSGRLAQPLTVIERRPDGSDLDRIQELADEYDVAEVVVGLPLSLKGEVGRQAKEALSYIEALRKRLNVPVETFDERLTTAVAQRTLITSDVKRKKRKQVVDKLAASLILQGYLDSKESEGRATGPGAESEEPRS